MDIVRDIYNQIMKEVDRLQKEYDKDNMTISQKAKNIYTVEGLIIASRIVAGVYHK